MINFSRYIGDKIYFYSKEVTILDVKVHNGCAEFITTNGVLRLYDKISKLAIWKSHDLTLNRICDRLTGNTYYDDNGNKIASLDDELMEYFSLSSNYTVFREFSKDFSNYMWDIPDAKIGG